MFRLKYLLFAGVFAVVAIGCSSEQKTDDQIAPESTSATEERPIDTAALSAEIQTGAETIASPDEGQVVQLDVPDSVTLEMVGQDGKTVFQVLAANHTVRTKSTAMGDYIYGIGAIAAENDYFWVYTLNDTMPKAAADRVITKNGDVIKWHFRRK